MPYVRSRPVWSSTPEVAAKFNQFKAWVGMTETMYEKYHKPPPPVDFAPAKKTIRDKVLVEALESFYKSYQPPPEIHQMPETEKDSQVETLEMLKEADAMHKELIPVLEAEIDFLQKSRVTVDTTVFDLEQNYPLIHEEIEDELDQRDWFKDTEFEPKKDHAAH